MCSVPARSHTLQLWKRTGKNGCRNNSRNLLVGRSRETEQTAAKSRSRNIGHTAQPTETASNRLPCQSAARNGANCRRIQSVYHHRCQQRRTKMDLYQQHERHANCCEQQRGLRRLGNSSRHQLHQQHQQLRTGIRHVHESGWRHILFRCRNLYRNGTRPQPADYPDR